LFRQVFVAKSRPKAAILNSIVPTPSSLSLTVGAGGKVLSFIAKDTLGRPYANALFSVTISDPTKASTSLAFVSTNSLGEGSATISPIAAGVGLNVTVAHAGFSINVPLTVATAGVVFASITPTPATLNLTAGGPAGNVAVKALDDQSRGFAGTFDLESTVPGDVSVPATVVTDANGDGSFAATPLAESGSTINIKLGGTTRATVTVNVAAAPPPGSTPLEDLDNDVSSLGGQRVVWYDENYGVTGDPASQWVDGIDGDYALTSASGQQPDVDAGGHLVFDGANDYLRRNSDAALAAEFGLDSLLITMVTTLTSEDGRRFFEISNGASARIALLAEPSNLAGLVQLAPDFVRFSTSGLTGCHVIHFRVQINPANNQVSETGLRIGELAEILGPGSTFTLSADKNRLTIAASRADTPASFGALGTRGFYVTKITGLALPTVDQIVGLFNDYAEAELLATIAAPVSPVFTSVVVSPTSVTLQEGGSSQAVTITTRDQFTQPMGGVLVDVASENTGVATVSSATVTTDAQTAQGTFNIVPQGAGTTNVTIKKLGVTYATIPVTVQAPVPPDTTVATVTMVPLSATIEQGLSTVFEAFAFNAAGQILDEKSFSWSSPGSGTLVTLTQFGLGKKVLVQANAVGSTTVTANCEGVGSAPSPVQITPAGTGGVFWPNTNIEKPRDKPVFVQPTLLNGRIHAGREFTATSFSNLQTLCANAQIGDRIMIPRGVDWNVTTLNLKDMGSGAGPGTTGVVQLCVVNPDDGTYGVFGDRLPHGPTLHAQGKLAVIRPAINTNAVGFQNGARGWWVGPGIAFAPRTSTSTHTGSMGIRFGSTSETNPANTPENCIADRVYAFGDGKAVQDVMLAGGRYFGIVGCDIRGIAGAGFESHAILGGNGGHVGLIHNNRCEAASIAIMFGGLDPKAQAMIPSDITLTNNYGTKDPAWASGQGRVIKNHFEMKVGIRFEWRHNVGARCDPDEQGTWGTFKSVNQTGVGIWNVCRDIAFIENVGFDTPGMIQLASAPQLVTGSVAERLNRVFIQGNLFYNMDYGVFDAQGDTLQLDGGLDYIVIRDNTFLYHPNDIGSRTVLCVRKSTVGVGFEFTNNIMQHRTFGWFTDTGGLSGVAAVNALFVSSGSGSYTIGGNVYISGPSGHLPGSNFYPATEAEVFVNYPGGDFHLTPSAQIAFGNVGCPLNTVLAATSGVVSP
jgi:hypothetical protein